MKRKETPPGVPDGLSRRRFLGLAGASAALAGLSGCSRPSEWEEVVPYTQRADEIVPGIASYYASTWQEGCEAHGVLVKTREGRPIHIEGNDLCPGSLGCVTTRTQAQVFSLYDPARLRQPVDSGTPVSWDLALERLFENLGKASSGPGEVLLLTGAVLSPSRRLLLEELGRAIPNLRHVQWEPVANHASRFASTACYGMALLPGYEMGRARTILSLADDFLGSGNLPASALKSYGESRRILERSGGMSRLWVVEGRMTLTGSNADHRILLRPSRAAVFAFALARELHESFRLALPNGVRASDLGEFEPATETGESGPDPRELHALAADLAVTGEDSLVLAGPELAPEAHVACHLLNEMLGAVGKTVTYDSTLQAPDLATPMAMSELTKEMAGGGIAAMLCCGVNPSYALPDAASWNDAMSAVPIRVALTLKNDETARSCQLVLPINHWLESWGDYRTATGAQNLQQPVIAPLHDTLQEEDILLGVIRKLTGTDSSNYRDFMMNRWQREVYPAGSPVPFRRFWNVALHDAVLRREAPSVTRPKFRPASVSEAAGRTIRKQVTGMELTLHPDGRVYDGRHASNSVLQELPDPVSKIVWGNALALSPTDARARDIRDGDLVDLSVDEVTIRIPAVVQPGQAAGVLSAPLGYGCETDGDFAGVGVNTYPLLETGSVTPCMRTGVNISKSGENGVLVRTQKNHSMEGRDLARSLTLEEYVHHGAAHASYHPEADLYPKIEFSGHHWAMVVDLNTCIGCSTCMLACQSENNVSVVGPEQVEMGREMNWIRLDRYYGDPIENPDVVHQPVMCQHCDKAPCENVCPVNATTHSPEGLNQMAYNRCVGTRYCANNCPYKVRRFNFFELNDDLRVPIALAFNPEVSVRPRGVMEKCTFCVQRIQDARARARIEGREVRDGEIRPACSAACPTDSIVFGDLNDPESAVAKLWGNDRGYRMLHAELGVEPSITYLAKLRNLPEVGDSHG